ncbi:MAG: CotH kinase family protein [Myxococcota bacterium]
MFLASLFLACRATGSAPEPDDPSAASPLPRIVLDEGQPANRTTLLDEDGDSSDWLELRNADSVPVDLAGWTLSDDPADPAKWTFPPRILAPDDRVLVFASGKDRLRQVVAWDTVVDEGDPWRYLAVEGPTPPDWFAPGFDDRGWDVGPSGFGHGDDDDATEVWKSTVYARITFTLTDDALDALQAVALHVDYDDGFVAYLNGAEIARANVASDGPPPWDAPATASHEALLYQGGAPERFDVPPSALVTGVNTLAVEVHDSAESSDLTLVPFLSLGYADPRPVRSSGALHPDPVHLHTSFSLSAGGERVLLSDPAGRIADEVDPAPLLGDQSYGRRPEDGAFGYFLEATPGAPNTTPWRADFAPAPTFDPPPGPLLGGGAVRVDAGGAVVRVAVGGASPTADDPVVTGPLQTGTGHDAVVFRARAEREGSWPSPVVTATYLLADPGPLPVVSVVAEPADLFDEQTGIYVLGPSYDPEVPNEGANFWDDRQVPTHVALWEPGAAQSAFSVDAGLSIHGGYSRAHDQRSLLVDLDDGEIAYPVFPDLDVTSYTRILLRAAGNDWLGCYLAGCAEGAHLRDALVQQLVAGLDIDLMGYRPATTYLNGAYWGVYNLREQPGKSWIRSHHGLDDVDLLELHASVVAGDAAHYDALLDWMRTHDLADPDAYAYVTTQMDTEEYATYLALELFADNGDWPGNNVKFWRPRTPDGRWRWMVYDTDFGVGAWYGDPAADTLAVALEAGTSWPNPAWSTELFRLLVTSPDFTATFLNHYADLLNTRFDSERSRAVLAALADGLAPEVPAQVARWGTWSDGTVTYTLEADDWVDEIERMDAWLAQRPAHAREQLMAHFRIQGTWTLSLDADPPGAGRFALAAVEVDGPFSGTYFRGVPVRVTALPAPGHRFTGWSGDAAGDDPVAIAADRATALVAHFD